jgi:hypothetical protein
LKVVWKVDQMVALTVDQMVYVMVVLKVDQMAVP